MTELCECWSRFLSQFRDIWARGDSHVRVTSSPTTHGETPLTGLTSRHFELQSPMADYDIFRERLAIKYPSYGHALWEPSPRNPDRPVQIGDVGFVRRGKFHRLFNALLSKDDPSHVLGVPEYHEPLVPTSLDHLRVDTRSLGRNHYCSPGVSIMEPDPGYHSG